MTKTPTEEAWEGLAELVETPGAHWRLTDSPEDDCVDVPVADLRLALSELSRLQAERDRAKADADLCAEHWAAEIERSNSIGAMAATMHAALKKAERFIVNGVEMGFIRMPDADTPDPAHDALPAIQAALAALTTQEETKP